jgi:DNA-binding NarL/FixJ family response regulator
MTDGPVRVLIADDNAVLRMGLGHLLGDEPGIEVVGEATSGEHAVELAAELRPDVVLLDVRMPGSYDGVVAAGQLVDHTVVIMLTYSDDLDVVRAALAAGVRGYLVHGDVRPQQILDAVRDAVAGRTVLSPRVSALLVEQLVAAPAAEPARAAPPDHGLTARECEIMALMAEGLRNDEIAGRLFISGNTLKNHITRIFGKLGVTTRAQAVSYWLRERSPGTPSP